MKVWNTNPISLLRMWASSSSSISDTIRSLSMYVPFEGVSRQPIRFIRVDFPDPEGPMMATYDPRTMEKVTPLRAWICSVPIW